MPQFTLPRDQSYILLIVDLAGLFVESALYEFIRLFLGNEPITLDPKKSKRFYEAGTLYINPSDRVTNDPKFNNETILYKPLKSNAFACLCHLGFSTEYGKASDVGVYSYHGEWSDIHRNCACNNPSINRAQIFSIFKKCIECTKVTVFGHSGKGLQCIDHLMLRYGRALKSYERIPIPLLSANCGSREMYQKSLLAHKIYMVLDEHMIADIISLIFMYC